MAHRLAFTFRRRRNLECRWLRVPVGDLDGR
jgi:hypothetical protein